MARIKAFLSFEVRMRRPVSAVLKLMVKAGVLCALRLLGMLVLATTNCRTRPGSAVCNCNAKSLPSSCLRKAGLLLAAFFISRLSAHSGRGDLIIGIRPGWEQFRRCSQES